MIEHDLDKKWIEIRLEPDGNIWIRAVKVVDMGSVDYQSQIATTREDMFTKLQKAIEELYASNRCSRLN